MNTEPTKANRELFASTMIFALYRGEATGRLPLRFTGDGAQLWKSFRHELSSVDLLDLAVRDTATIMPIPFAYERLWPRTRDANNVFAEITPGQVEEWIRKGSAFQNLPTSEYLRLQAQSLDIKLLVGDALEELPNPLPHQVILELPGSGGWLAYSIATRADASVYYWENFTIACGSWQEQCLAGLTAFELGAPPAHELPIVYDPTLSHVLRQQVTGLDWIIGFREQNSHRAEALHSFLKPGGKVILL